MCSWKRFLGGPHIVSDKYEERGCSLLLRGTTEGIWVGSREVARRLPGTYGACSTAPWHLSSCSCFERFIVFIYCLSKYIATTVGARQYSANSNSIKNKFLFCYQNKASFLETFGYIHSAFHEMYTYLLGWSISYKC